jgi:hypothetical protein
MSRDAEVMLISLTKVILLFMRSIEYLQVVRTGQSDMADGCIAKQGGA